MNTKTEAVSAKYTDKPLAFALGGEIVSDWRRARRIQLQASIDGRAWLVPQARNVAILLRRAAIAKATGAKS